MIYTNVPLGRFARDTTVKAVGVTRLRVKTYGSRGMHGLARVCRLSRS